MTTKASRANISSAIGASAELVPVRDKAAGWVIKSRPVNYYAGETSADALLFAAEIRASYETLHEAKRPASLGYDATRRGTNAHTGEPMPEPTVPERGARTIANLRTLVSTFDPSGLIPHGCNDRRPVRSRYLDAAGRGPCCAPESSTMRGSCLTCQGAETAPIHRREAAAYTHAFVGATLDYATPALTLSPWVPNDLYTPADHRPIVAPAPFVAPVKVARKARAPRPVIMPEPIAPVQAEQAPEPAEWSCADCGDQTYPFPIMAHAVYHVTEAPEPIQASPAPVLTVVQPAQRPTCERCGQVFRMHGTGAEWHRVNRPDCAVGRLSVAS